MSSIFDVNLNKLDQAWLEQAPLYYEHAMVLADARREHERAKAERDLVTAELDWAIRLTPSEYGVEKITEGAVEKTALLQRGYREAVAKLIDAKHLMDTADAMVRALEHRKATLESLVTFESRNYFAAPRARGEDGRRMEEVEKRAARSAGRRK